MTIQRNYDGSWTVSDIVDGYWVWRRYFGYSKRGARARFRAEVRGEA